MRRTRALRALLLTVLACLLAAAPAVAAPGRGDGDVPRQERAARIEAWSDQVRDAAIALWERMRDVIGGDTPTKSDRTPGAGQDPDGHRPSAE